MKKLLLTFLMTFSFIACNEEPYDYGYVNFYIDPESTEYFNLNTGNRGWEYFEGGMRGVVIFRIKYGDYICFERSCTLKDCHGRLEVDTITNMLLKCPKCHSSFLCIDGSPTSGSVAKRNLYAYCDYFDGHYLWVYNCN